MRELEGSVLEDTGDLLVAVFEEEAAAVAAATAIAEEDAPQLVVGVAVTYGTADVGSEAQPWALGIRRRR